MFYKYEIKNNGTEDILYLYVTFKYEFSNELNFNEDKKLCSISKKFITDNNINYKGNKVYLVADGFVVKKIDLNSNSNYSLNSNYMPDNFLINIKLDDGSLCEITLREYLLSILLSKYNNEFDDEVFKAICILFNTYAYKMMSENKYINSLNSFALYMPSNDYRSNYIDFDVIKSKLNLIIDEVKCIFLSYDDKYILPFIHISNSGKTISNRNYPFLSSVKSLWDMTSKNYINVLTFKYDELNKLLGINIDYNTKISFCNNNSIKFNDNVFSIEELRNKLNLVSNHIYIIINSYNIEFICIGIGNSLGLSLFGSNEIAKNGGKYFNILNYYFPKTKIYRYIKELS